MFAKSDPRMHGMNMRRPVLRVHHGLDPEQPMAGIEEQYHFDNEAEQDPTVVGILKDLFANGPPSPAQEAASWNLSSEIPIMEPAQTGTRLIEPRATMENPFPLSSLDAVLPRSRLSTSGSSTSSLPSGQLQGPVNRPEPPRAPRSDLIRAQRGELSERGEWKRIENALRKSRLGRIHERKRIAHAPKIVPESLEDWKRQKRWNAARRAIEARRRDEENHRIAIQLQEQNQLGFSMSHLPAGADGRGTILGMPTIWTALPQGAHPFRPVADWPMPQEFMEEGNERNTSHFGRFMPMLRDPCNGTVAWKMRPQMAQFVFDFVSPIPLPPSSQVVQLRLPDGTYIDDDSQFGRTAYNLEHPDNDEVKRQQQMLALGPPPPLMAEPFHPGVLSSFDMHTGPGNAAANRDKRSLRAMEYEQRAQTMGEVPLRPFEANMGQVPPPRQHQRALEPRPIPGNAPTGSMPPSQQHERDVEAQSVHSDAFIRQLPPARRIQHQHGVEAQVDPRNPFLGSMLPPLQHETGLRLAPDDKFLGQMSPMQQRQAEAKRRVFAEQKSRMDAIDRAAAEEMLEEEDREYWPDFSDNDNEPEPRGETPQGPRNAQADAGMQVEPTAAMDIGHARSRRPFAYNPNVETFVPAAIRPTPPLSEVQKGKQAELSSGDSAIDEPDTAGEDDGDESDSSQITVVPARPQTGAVPVAAPSTSSEASEEPAAPKPGRRNRRGKHKWKGKAKNKWKSQRGNYHGWLAR